MSGAVELVGSFADERDCVRAIEALRHERVTSFSVFTPIPSEHIAEAIGLGRSPVRAWVLIGGIIGVISGFALTIGTSMEWNLIAGGKPIASIPPYLIIVFELMVLLGGLSAVLSFIVLGGMPVFEPLPGFSARFAGDRFGVAVRCAEPEMARLEALLQRAGAERIDRHLEPSDDKIGSHEHAHGPT